MRTVESSIYLKILALCRFQYLRLRFSDRLKIEKLSYIGKAGKFIISLKGKIHIRGKINIRDNVELQAQGILEMGYGCGINSFSRIIAFERITIGNQVSIAQFVSIFDHDHDYSLVDNKLNLKGFKTQPINIGNYVWIGDKVTITKGVTIGDNVVIGANSVVTKDIPSNSIAVGSPARVLKTIS